MVSLSPGNGLKYVFSMIIYGKALAAVSSASALVVPPNLGLQPPPGPKLPGRSLSAPALAPLPGAVFGPKYQSVVEPTPSKIITPAPLVAPLTV